jgi:hypothetical protein
MLSFTPVGSYPAGANLNAIVAADFNNDGNLDLASAGGFSATRVRIRLGDGLGGFGEEQQYDYGYWGYPSSMAAADFNNDDRLDIVVTDSAGFAILMNNGDGTFQSAVVTFADFAQVAVGHFNSDSNIDLLVGWYHWDFGLHYQPYLGDGEGGFAAGLAYQIGGDPYKWGNDRLAAVELNHDGKLDVVIGDGRVLLGNGNGTFQYEYGQPVPVGSGAIATGDFTGDGNSDVIVSGNSLAVLPSRGDGGFDAPIHHLINGGAVATADFNADGRLDAIMIDPDVGGVSLMLGNGDGTLQYADSFPTGSLPSGVAVGDFNGDGRPDVAVSNAGANYVSVLLNDGNWINVPPAPSTLSISDATVTEGDYGTTNATFEVTLAQPSAVDVTVRYDTANITATAATDYAATSGTLTIPAGQTSRTFTVPIKGDLVAELTETFAVNLSNSTNAVIADGQAIGTILDNEPRPRISINDVRTTEGNSKTPKYFTFTVSLSAAFDQAITVNYATASGTATAGSDYQSKTGSITFAPGETTKTITVAVIGDKQKESDETFFVNLSGAVGAEITDGQGLGTILNDDSGSKGRPSATASALDAAIEDWMFSVRKSALGKPSALIRNR